MAIPKDIIEKIKEAADIVDIIGEFVTLKKKGPNWWGCCPFHNEKTCSFSVLTAKQTYRCFGCEKGGNAITFLQEHEQMSFPEAVKWLGKKYNIEVPEKELTPEEQSREKHRESLQIAIRAGQAHFTDNLSNKIATEYLSNRNFAQGDETLIKYMVGFAPSGNLITKNLAKQGYNLDLLKATGLVDQGENGNYDSFRNRITFPFLSITGNIIGFSGRIIDDKKGQGKYYNTKATELFNKSAVIFGLYQAKKEISTKDKVYWVEGQFDVLSFAKAGIGNTVCGSGTAMTADHIKMLCRFTRNITLIYDGDAAGLAAGKKNLALLVEAGVAVRVIELPLGDDPDSFAQKVGKDMLLSILDKREVDFVTWLAKQANQDDPEQKEKDLNEIVNLIAKLNSETLQHDYIKNITKILDTDSESIKRKIKFINKDIPVDEDIPPGFYGIEEAQELLSNSSDTCILTCTFEVFTKHYGDTPTVYVKGTPKIDSIQKFRRSISTIEFHERHLLIIPANAKESEQLLLLKMLFINGITINVLEIATESPYVGFVEYYIKLHNELLKDATEGEKAIYIDRCAELISYANDTVRTVMMSSWAANLGLKISQYKEILKPYLDKRKSKSAISIQRRDFDDVLMAYDPERIPEYVTKNPEYKRMYDRYGFYPLLKKEGEPVCYMFKNNGSGHTQVADFYMIPLLHIHDQDSEYNKRVIKINRLQYDTPVYLEIKSSRLASLQSFEEVLLNEEGLNFENGDNKHFRTIRGAMSHSYIKCYELKTFGFQQEGFFAFSNAIFHEIVNEDNKKEYRIDYCNDFGVMSHEKGNYYTPAYSQIYANLRKDSDKYQQHRYFIYKDIAKEEQCSFGKWAALMDEVYNVNDNGKWAVIYAIMCAFRSDIHAIDRLFTAIFFVGPSQSGKTQVAISVRSLFVEPRAPIFNLNSGTDAAFFTLMEGFRDVPQVLEEYNNKEISKDKFQGLKSVVYDGDGKQKRKNADGKEITTSQVNSPVVILGQETPERDDNALMNRVVLCEVPTHPGEYTTHETEIFQKLKEHEKIGLCNILFEVLKLRNLVQEHFKSIERKVNKDLTAAVLSGSEASGDMVRIIKTVSLFLSMCKLLVVHAPQLKLPFTYDEFFVLAKNKVKWQLELISHTDKLSGFFKAVEVISYTGVIKEGRDYAISTHDRVTIKGSGKETIQVSLTPGTKVLFIRLSNLHNAYTKSSYNTESATLSTIEQNLRSNPSYIGVVNTRKFKWEETVEVRKSLTDNEMHRVIEEQTKSTSCIALNYDVFRKYFDVDMGRNIVPNTGSIPNTEEIPTRGVLTEVPTPDNKLF